MEILVDDPAVLPSGPARWWEDAERVDVALYAAIAHVVLSKVVNTSQGVRARLSSS